MRLIRFRKCFLMYSMVPLIVGGTASYAATVSTSESKQSPGQKYLNQAVRSFQLNKFKQAEIELRQSVAENSNSAIAHYYLANTLVHLQRHDEAVEEFQRSYRLDPHGEASVYCRKALTTYGVVPTGDIALAGKTQAASSDKILALKKQAEKEKIRHQDAADLYVRWTHSTAEREAQQIRIHGREEADVILNNPLSRSPIDRSVAAQRADSVRANSEEMANIAKERAAQRALQASQWSQHKGRMLDEAVSNMEGQLKGKALPGTPKLKEEGTDLFVRNYDLHSTASSFVTPATVKVSNQIDSAPKIVPATVSISDNENGHKAQQNISEFETPASNRLIAQPPVTSKNVHGQIVPPM